MILLPLVGIIAGARSISPIVTDWNDHVLCHEAGWQRIPDETTYGRILRTFTRKNINQMGTLNHRIRANIWRNVPGRQRKFFKAGLEVEASIPPMQWLNLYANFWLIYPIEPIYCFVETVAFLWGNYWIFSMIEVRTI